MRFKFVSLLLAGAVALAASNAQAQNTFNGVDIYVTGDGPAIEPAGFSPGDPSNQLLDDGTGGDATASDGIYSRTITAGGGDGAARQQWKVASTGFSPVSYPFGLDNGWTVTTNAASMDFFFDTNTKGDGFVPDPDGSTILGILYTVPSPVLPADTVAVVGGFNGQLGGTDWDAADLTLTMVDDGTGGDTTGGDGIYTYSFTDVTAGNYGYKILMNGATEGFNKQVSVLGFATGGGNLAVNIFDTADNVRILFDSATGRAKAESDNILANPGPPFFASSDAWATGLVAETQLFDDGTNGDVTASDGIYSREFLTAITSGDQTVQILQGVGASFPGTGGYPFVTTSFVQFVLVQFDTNDPGDGFSPADNYVWVDPAARRIPTWVQAVGTFQVDFGGIDWNNDDADARLFDDGAGVDAAAGDNIFTGTPSIPAASGGSRVWKGLGEQASWDYQFGGAGDGATVFGNNPDVAITITGGDQTNFVVDVTTGRVGSNDGSSAAPAPTRPPSIDEPASIVDFLGVTDWSMYE